MTAHGTALLTSLRTVAGAVGTAVFVGIMTAVRESSVGRYGDAAGVHGINVTFFWMAAVSALLVLIGIFFVKREAK